MGESRGSMSYTPHALASYSDNRNRVYVGPTGRFDSAPPKGEWATWLHS
jgi:hypothetical protein